MSELDPIKQYSTIRNPVIELGIKEFLIKTKETAIASISDELNKKLSALGSGILSLDAIRSRRNRAMKSRERAVKEIDSFRLTYLPIVLGASTLILDFASDLKRLVRTGSSIQTRQKAVAMQRKLKELQEVKEASSKIEQEFDEALAESETTVRKLEEEVSLRKKEQAALESKVEELKSEIKRFREQSRYHQNQSHAARREAAANDTANKVSERDHEQTTGPVSRPSAQTSHSSSNTVENQGKASIE
ncbi:hypothetical protein HK102_010980 [Quaeritorhiza haematococci]|nr:hypothetical protein HK102_010980 [Quaeritorhiza haematococci]